MWSTCDWDPTPWKPFCEVISVMNSWGFSNPVKKAATPGGSWVLTFLGFVEKSADSYFICYIIFEKDRINIHNLFIIFHNRYNMIYLQKNYITCSYLLILALLVLLIGWKKVALYHDLPEAARTSSAPLRQSWKWRSSRTESCTAGRATSYAKSSWYAISSLWQAGAMIPENFGNLCRRRKWTHGNSVRKWTILGWSKLFCLVSCVYLRWKS